MTDRDIQDLQQELDSLKEELRKIRLERTGLKRQVANLTNECKDLRKLNTEYTQLLADRPVTRSKLQETIKLQADQIANLQHDLQVERITDQYSSSLKQNADIPKKSDALREIAKIKIGGDKKSEEYKKSLQRNLGNDSDDRRERTTDFKIAEAAGVSEKTDDKRVSDLESKVQALETENATLRATYTEQLQSENTNLRNDFTEQLKALEDENAELRKALEKYTFKAEDLTPARRGRPRTISNGTRQQIKDLQAQGCSIRKIAQLLNVSTGFVHKTLKQV